MLNIQQTGAWTPEELYVFFEKHGLLSVGMLENPQRIVDLSMMATFYIWYEEKTPVALMLDLPESEPGIKNIMVIPEDRTMGKRLFNEILDSSIELRDLWFKRMNARRVQSIVPISRVNMQRILRALGFKEETRSGVGIRGMFALNGQDTQAAVIYGLIPSDPIPVKRKPKEELAAEFDDTLEIVNKQTERHMEMEAKLATE